MRSRNMEEDKTEERHLWRLGMDNALRLFQIYCTPPNLGISLLGREYAD